MLQETLLEFFERDLNKLYSEIELYENESQLWIVKEGITNSAGNLCLHLIGNLRHFIGAIMGKSGYVRERDKEFTLKNISKKDLLDAINDTKSLVIKILSNINQEDLDKNYPIEKHDKIVTNENMLVHLFGHLSYHLGQINYHRRLLAIS
ncbi:MAG TPA: DinB family protein [Bacteroidia bacterium]|nr:DinB family protein [Bacteroidia bacterium]